MLHGCFFMEPSPKPATKNTSDHPINSRKRIMGFHITCTATSQRVKRALNLIVLFSSNTSKNVKRHQSFTLNSSFAFWGCVAVQMHKTSKHEWNLAKSRNNQQYHLLKQYKATWLWQIMIELIDELWFEIDTVHRVSVSLLKLMQILLKNKSCNLHRIPSGKDPSTGGNPQIFYKIIYEKIFCWPFQSIQTNYLFWL